MPTGKEHKRQWPNARPMEIHGWLTRLRLWMAHSSGDFGYLTYKTQLGEAVLTYCDNKGQPRRQATYRRVGKGTWLLLKLGTLTALVKRCGQVVIDNSHAGLHAWLYTTTKGKLYLRIPSAGWFTSDLEPRVGTVWTEQQILWWQPSNPDPDASVRAAKRVVPRN